MTTKTTKANNGSNKKTTALHLAMPGKGTTLCGAKGKTAPAGEATCADCKKIAAHPQGKAKDSAKAENPESKKATKADRRHGATARPEPAAARHRPQEARPERLGSLRVPRHRERDRVQGDRVPLALRGGDGRGQGPRCGRQRQRVLVLRPRDATPNRRPGRRAHPGLGPIPRARESHRRRPARGRRQDGGLQRPRPPVPDPQRDGQHPVEMADGRAIDAPQASRLAGRRCVWSHGSGPAAGPATSI